MSIELNGLNAQQQLDQIAKMAYGSGKNEAAMGGAGNIGILNGRVVKFNTHWTERLGGTTDAMRASCNQLRESLMDIAQSLVRGSDGEVSPRQQATLAKIRQELGLGAEGTTVSNKKLLDRTVVARVISEIDQATHHSTWSAVSGAAGHLASTGVDTHFATLETQESEVNAFVANLDLDIDEGLAAVEHPADGKPGVKLNQEERTFLKGLIKEDVEVRRSYGEKLPTADEIKKSLADFSSPALSATLQCFNKYSEKLAAAYSSTLGKTNTCTSVLSGVAPQDRKDAARLALLLHGLTSVEATADFLTPMAFLMEKLPEMRQLQPQGPLTMDTVWRACFIEDAPKGTAPSGSPATAQAFTTRMNKMVEGRIDALQQQNHLQPKLVKTNFVMNMFSGMKFSAALSKAIDEPGYTFDATRDMLAYPPLYAVEDAMDKSDADIAHQLGMDVVRQNLKVTFVAEPGGEPVVIETRKGETDVESKVSALMEKLKSFAGPDHEAQFKVSCFGLCQAAFTPFTSAMGVGGEHSDCDITVSKNAQGGITLRYQSTANSRIDVSYTYEINADGANRFGEEYTVRNRA